MEVREGYKKTEVGVIPHDWTSLKVEECVSIKTGNKNTEDKISNGVFPFYVRSQQVERINSFSFDCEAVLTAGDGVGTGKVFHYINGKFDAHQRVYVMSDFKYITGKYFHSYFSNFFYDEVCKYTAKSSVDSVRRDMIAKMLIPIPSLPEQHAIATALSDIDGLISSLTKLIDKKNNIKQGVMQELLTGNRRLKGFNCSWGIKTLGEICEIKDGTHQTPNYVYSGIPFYSVENVTQDEFENTKFISEDEHKILTKSFKIEKGDILMTRIGSIGVCKYIDWDVDASFYVSLALLKVKNGFNGRFICQYTNADRFKKEIELHSLQSAIPKKINLGKISNIRLFIPESEEEQGAIANVLNDMDLEIEKLQNKLNKYKVIKQGMMQELLTGRIRLIESNAGPKRQTAKVSKSIGHTKEFDEAVVVSVIVSRFANEQYPMGPFRRQKYAYLLHRRQENKVEGYEKFAAGPYNYHTKYGGAERIARNNKYVKEHMRGKVKGFISAENSQQAIDYFNKWYGNETLDWLEQFRYKNKEELELLTTIDMAMVDVRLENKEVNVATVKAVLQDNTEWKDKLKRNAFADKNIKRAIAWSSRIFGN